MPYFWCYKFSVKNAGRLAFAVGSLINRKNNEILLSSNLLIIIINITSSKQSHWTDEENETGHSASSLKLPSWNDLKLWFS